MFQPQSVLKDVECTGKAQRGFWWGKMLSEHLLFAADHHGGLLLVLCILDLSNTEVMTL